MIGKHNGIEFRVSHKGKQLDFVGVTNVVGDHCVDTLSDAKNAKLGFGHRAADPRLKKDGSFSASSSLTTGGVTLHTTIGAAPHKHGKRLSGTISEHQGPSSTLPSGCSIDVSFKASRK